MNEIILKPGPRIRTYKDPVLDPNVPYPICMGPDPDPNFSWIQKLVPYPLYSKQETPDP